MFVPSEVQIYNNLFLRDRDQAGNNGVPLELDNVPLSALQMNNNGYGYGRIVGEFNFIKFGGLSYNLSSWKTYTSGQGYPKDVNSVYEPNPANLKLAVDDYKLAENADFGKLLAGSVVIDAGNAEYAPSLDLWGTVRPQGAGDDIGAFEYVGDNDTTPPSAPGGLSVQ